ncbi:MAG: inorganic phosphate transporter [Bacteroidetes bacterium]|nr:MAG: inorganic phosphate transporter [Bacteroidota bacterium]
MFGFEADLSTPLLILLGITIFTVCLFEFVNGFHDTANAVATVIYTGSLQPIPAVVWSGLMNFAGVLASGYFFGMGVAMKIVSLLPIEALIGQDLHHSIAMVLSVLIGAIIWNVATWYKGIPCSSSHTLIGSLLGVGLVFSFLPENTEHVGVNWSEAIKIGNSLLFSPAFGFSMAIVLMFILRLSLKDKKIFKEPEPGAPPPWYIRGVLILTCTLVSFFHGSNDGQKGIGLLLIVLMTFLPLQFALSPNFSAEKVDLALENIQRSLPERAVYPEIGKVQESLVTLRTDIKQHDPKNVKQRLALRKRLLIIKKQTEALLQVPNIITDKNARHTISGELKVLVRNTTYPPIWSVVLISLSLGIGTMIGWKRIVVTIGEKIGKRHMTYAEGATAELVASSTIGLASSLGLPVSTTHVLSSGVAGAMVASKGVKNLQTRTIKDIALAWILTLPVTMVLSGMLYWVLRNII